jgi:hypothetical protein
MGTILYPYRCSRGQYPVSVLHTRPHASALPPFERNLPYLAYYRKNLALWGRVDRAWFSASFIHIFVLIINLSADLNFRKALRWRMNLRK